MKFWIKAILSVLLWFLIVWNISLATNWNLPWVKIITREQRWVDESIRIRSAKSSTSSSTTQTPAQIEAARISSVRNAWMAKNYPNAWKYEASVTMTWDKYWIYPDYFNYHKTKIIIHHTATDYNPGWTKQEVMKQIQLMYRYHVIDRDFWDIGYNFIIDQLWNIYEWRHWWEGAVWMHTANNNASSIWISLMWNFENDVPTEAQLWALVNLVTALARYYNIDPNWTTYTFQTNTTKDPYVVAKQNPTILWHKDVAVTACPGKNLYSFLPKLREEVSFRLKNNIVWDMPIPTSWTDSLSKMENKTSSISKTSVKKNKKSFSESLKEIQTSNPNLLYSAGDKMKDRYKWKLVEASQKSAKILKKYTTNDLKNLLKQDISVLLYELTTEYDTFQITCDTSCSFNIDWAAYNLTGANITITQNHFTAP